MYLQFTILHGFYTQLCVNNTEVTVNTCTCTMITTKNQSCGIFKSNRTGIQVFIAVSKLLSATVL